jgi:predicted esterase
MGLRTRFGCLLLGLSVVFGRPSFGADKADLAGGVAPDQATFAAGKETKILDPQTGGVGYYFVYVPKDYTPDREWPTIFCYHGKDQTPKTWPFKELTDGQGYIVIGMEYLKRGIGEQDPVADVANLKRILKFVSSKMHVNAKLMFMGGFSQGGWSTASFSNQMMDQLAGLVILGAGGSPGEKASALLKGKPVFVGVGESDDVNKSARESEKAFAGKGAVTTFEEFKGLGHAVDTKDKPLKDWLLKWGPQNQMIAALAVAKATEKAGRLGEAYTQYVATAKMSGGEEADELAKAIAEPAEKKLADAEAALAAKKYPDAVKLLMAVSQTYAGSTFAEKAKQQVDQIQADPSIKAEIEQAKLDARADAVETAAQGAEKVKDYSRAISLYESYVAQFPKSAHYAAMKSHLDELKANKSILASAKGQSADRECKGWLSTADNYIKNDMGEKAKPYLQKIVEKYGDTDWAAQAKKRLAELK